MIKTCSKSFFPVIVFPEYSYESNNHLTYNTVEISNSIGIGSYMRILHGMTLELRM